MKSILLSIKPKWVAKILNGEKTIEIRKTMPKCDLPIDVYIYCTKENKPIDCGNNESLLCSAIQTLNSLGKVVAKFTLRKVEEFTNDELWEKCFKTEELITKSCVPFSRLMAYSRASSIYAYHIEDLVIFDKPRELSEFYTLNLPNPKHIKFANWKANYYWALGDFSDKCPGNMMCDEVVRRFKKSISIKKAPQNFCYVESEE